MTTRYASNRQAFSLARSFPRLDTLNLLSEDFDDSAQSIEEQIVNAFGVDLDLNEEADIKEAGHVW
jgi:hypothetical protein